MTDLMTGLSHSPVLCDGGMGTQLLEAGLPTTTAGEAWNLDHPDAIEQIHRAYHGAGCRIITTNTFGGSSAALARHGLQAKADQINEAAARLARRVVGDDGWVAGNLGPFGGFLEPLGDDKPDDVKAMFARQAAALKRGGADVILVETMADPGEAALAIAAARELDDEPIIAAFAFEKGPGQAFATMMGADVPTALTAARDAGADIVGANCGTGLGVEDYRHLAEQLLAAAGDAPVIVQPNAGAPQVTAQGTVYAATPDDMAELARDLTEMGVRIVGGCCGTTPRHLAAMAGQMT